jgi:hypothetical protein
MWKRTSTASVLVLVIGMVLPGLARAESRSEPSWSVAFGTGFVADPDGFLMAFELERRFNRHFALGTLLTLGLEDDDTLAAPHAYGRFIFQLGRQDEGGVSNLEPFLQAGLGFTHLDRDGSGKHRGENTSFSMIFGGGLDYHFSDWFAVGSRMLVGVVPAEVKGESAYFSWEIARIRFTF